MGFVRKKRYRKDWRINKYNLFLNRTILGIILQGVNVGKAASWPIPKDVDDNGHITY
jgi:hypothetical protein